LELYKLKIIFFETLKRISKKVRYKKEKEMKSKRSSRKKKNEGQLEKL
jgi:hypothetical protein